MTLRYRFMDVRAAQTEYACNLPAFYAVVLMQYDGLNISVSDPRTTKNVPSTNSTPEMKSQGTSNKTPKWTVMHTSTSENTDTEL
jgi:hypothetical protein